jgi:hypothetical protein
MCGVAEFTYFFSPDTGFHLDRSAHGYANTAAIWPPMRRNVLPPRTPSSHTFLHANRRKREWNEDQAPYPHSLNPGTARVLALSSAKPVYRPSVPRAHWSKRNVETGSHTYSIASPVARSDNEVASKTEKVKCSLQIREEGK